MKVRVFKVWGREIFRIEDYQESTVLEMVEALISERMARGKVVIREPQEGDPCACCGEPLTEDDIIDSQFSTMTEKLVWDACTEDHCPDDED